MARSNQLRSRGGEWSGYTLVEVVIAMSVFAVLALSVSASIASAMQAATRSDDRDRARMEATSHMEEVIAHPDFGTLMSTFNGDTFDVPGLTPPASQEKCGAVTVTSVTADSVRVDVVVTWHDASLDSADVPGVLTVELNTVIADRASL